LLAWDRRFVQSNGEEPMLNREELIHALTQLDPVAFEEVITSAYRQRYDPEGASGQSDPDPDATREQYALWLAKRHLASDAVLDRVVYLPTGSPGDEIRLLEVNRFLNPPDPDVVEPLDFTPDTDPPFKVFVADVTDDQWDRIEKGHTSILPAGWSLEGHQVITRG